MITNIKKTILTFAILFFANTLFAQNSKSTGYSSGNNPHVGGLKLQEDYQNGKTSMEEMVKKTLELQAQINEQNKYISKPLMVEPGYQVTVSGGKIGTVVPIPADDDRWWEK